MIPDLLGYSTLVFDCDGVILNSNRIKTEAFRSAALPYGEPAACALVAHHVVNGGVSRYLKFAYFLEVIVPEYAPTLVPGFNAPDLQELLLAYAQEVRAGLMSCPVANSLPELRAITATANWLIISGGDQAELRDVFDARCLSCFFDGGIFGSPDAKDTILARELNLDNIKRPALFLGDSRYDALVSKDAGLDFVFVSNWTEVADWCQFVDRNSHLHVASLADLIC
jgi:phosphoglycolate phosphatase-like HAD superfamily hydrolase